jgi:PAS domain S-box-containing protein
MQHDERFSAPMTDDGRYRLLVENIADYAIYMLDRGGIVTSWNAGAQRFKGYTASEIIGEHFSRFYTVDDRRRGLPARALATAERDGKFEAEGWRVRKDNTCFWASVIIDPVRDDDGRLVGFAKITRDLTERKKAEETLKASEQQFRMLVQSVTDYAIYMLDPQGYVSNWNPGAERIKGYAPDEIVGQHFSRFYTAQDRANGEPERALQMAFDEGRYAKEGWRVRKDGTQFWASVVIDPIRDEDGTLLGFAKVTRDATERRDAERALGQAREALFQSQKMEAIGQLTGGVAHDFNNLLAAVLGSLELATKRLSGADRRTLSLIENAMEGARRGAALTQRMLAFARRQDLKPEAIEVRGLVEGMTELMRRSLGPRVRLENRVPETVARIKADVNQLEMALLNLMMNARDAMPDGGPIVVDAREAIINLPAEPGIKHGRYVCLSVTDSGEGMDEATLRKAAEPFFTTKGIGKGTGLGLPMAKGLAEQSGGHFRLISTKGQGTRAELWLPVADDAPAVVDATSDGVDQRRKRRALTVLAVDDDVLVLMNTVFMLEELGHTVLEASSGAKALEILRSVQQVDVVVTDQAMPGMTGLELGRVIHDEWPGTRLVLATGYGELPANPTVTFAKLSKPFLERDLASAIEQAPHAAGLTTRVRNLVGI